MKRLYMLMLCVLLALCVAASGSAGALEREYTPVTPVGEVPAEFADIVAENRFGNARWVGDKLVEVDSHLKWLDMNGNVIASYEIPQGGYCSVKSGALLSTSDGGMLLTLGFQDRYLSETDTWASEAGVSSLVIKLDAQANVQWMAELDGVEGMMLQKCFETEAGYCFFGEQETPETKKLGVGSYTDLSVLVLDKQGQLMTVKTFGGSDFDMFWRAEKVEGGFAIYADSQSNDGLFENSLPEGEYSENWKVLLDEQFNVTGLERVEFAQLSAQQPVCWVETAALTGSTAGTVTLMLDYGDFTLVVSVNITGIYEYQPVALSSLWYTYETVYSAWQDGELLWRAAVDSSPDYDAMSAALLQLAE